MNKRTTEYNDLRVFIDTRIAQVLSGVGRLGVAGGGTETPVSTMLFGTPSVPVRLTFAPGSATTALRSDAQLAIDQSIAPAWTSLHTFGAGLRSPSYVSQTTGWAITAFGEADFRYLFVDEMHAKTFIADLEQALAGGQIISKSVAVVAVTFVVPAAGSSSTLWVNDLPSAPNMAAFQSGDIVRLRTFSRSGGSLTIADCWGTVTSYADGTGVHEGRQSWTFTRSSGANAGAMTAGTVIQPDAIVLDYGTSGNGFYEVNAIDGVYALNSPYAQIVTWSGHPATGSSVRGRYGNLRGIFGVTDEFGLFVGEGTGVTQKWLRLSSVAAELHNVPIKLFNGSTQTVNLDSAGVDVWIGPSSSDKRLSWNGTTLTVRGQIIVTDGAVGGRNLALNSSFELDSNNDGLANEFNVYNNDGGSVPVTPSIITGFVSPKAQRIAWTGVNASTKGISFNVGTYKADVWYTFSWWARVNTSPAQQLQMYQNVAPSNDEWLLNPTPATGVWQRYIKRRRWSSTTTDLVYISIQLGAAVAGSIDFDNVMVTEGEIQRDWEPSPRDIADNGRFILPWSPGTTGLHATSEYLGYWNTSNGWRTYLDNQGRFYFKGASGATLEWTGTRLEGRNSSSQMQWYTDSTTGAIVGGITSGEIGTIALTRNGLDIAGGTGFEASRSINFYASDGTVNRLGEVYGYRVGVDNAVRMSAYTNNSVYQTTAYVSALNEAGNQAYVLLLASKFTSPNSVQNPRSQVTLSSLQGANEASFSVFCFRADGTSSSFSLVRNAGGATFDVSNATKNFVIDHPTRPGMELVHSAVETDGIRTIYAGIATTNDDGFAFVELPGWFDALNGNRVYSLTLEGEPGSVSLWSSSDNSFTIKAPPSRTVHWMIVADRHDRTAREANFIVERPKRIEPMPQFVYESIEAGEIEERKESDLR